MPTSKTTNNHEQICKWAEARNAIPCEVRGTDRDGEPGILRFEFPKARNRNDAQLREISWMSSSRNLTKTTLNSSSR